MHSQTLMTHKSARADTDRQAHTHAHLLQNPGVGIGRVTYDHHLDILRGHLVEQPALRLT